MSTPKEATPHDPQEGMPTIPPTEEPTATGVATPAMEPPPLMPDWHAQYVHLYADFENYRKRMQRMQAGWRAAAQGEALAPLLPALDDLERALATPATETGDDPLRAGVLLIQQKLQETLRQQGVTSMGVAPGDAFDADRHEAIARRREETVEGRETVLEVVRQGYCYQDKVMRTAQVIVATA